MLAPIGLSAYRRLDHLQATIEALRANTLAAESELFVFSDGPAPGAEESVAAVRRYLATVSGFKRVEVVERASNLRAGNLLDGMRRLADGYGRFIFIEDDIVTAPGFLAFMNGALDFYQDHAEVMSICGYAAPVAWRPRGDVFALARFCAWGMAMTAGNFAKIRPLPADAHRSLPRERIVRCGRDIEKMLELQAAGAIDAYDVCAMYQQCLDGRLTIHPRKSLVQNIGHDGSGVHCAASTRFRHRELWSKTEGFVFDSEPCEDERNLKLNRRFRDTRPWVRRLFRHY